MSLRSAVGKMSIGQFATSLVILAAMTSAGVSIANVFVFARWGLDFSSVASPSDLMIGGVAVLQVLILQFILLFCALLLSEQIRSHAVKHKKFLRISETAMIVIGTIAFVFITFFQGPIFDNFFIHEHSLFGFYLCVSAIFLFRLLEDSVRLDDIYNIQAIVMFMASIMLSAVYVAQRGQGDLVTDVPESPCPAEDHVVWLNSDTVILTCAPPPFNRDNDYRIQDRSGLVFRTHRAEHF